MAGIIVAGWDAKSGEQVDSIPLGDMLRREAVTVGGCVASYIYGFVRELYCPDMTKADLCEICDEGCSTCCLP